MPGSSETTSSGVLDRVYDAVYEEEDARACSDISEKACTEVPRNFFLEALALSLARLGEAIVNTKTTLPWLLTSIGAPGWIAAVLVPVRESGSMLPQLAIAGWVRTLALRKWTYVVGTALQALCVFGIAASVLLLDGTTAGSAVLGLVVLLSLARGLCSVASKDVQGKTVPKRRRGKMTGFAASVAGGGTLVFAFVLWQLWEAQTKTDYLWLLIVGGAFWLLAAGLYGLVAEEPGATDGGANGLAEAFARLSLLADDQDFRLFVTVRTLLLGTALMAPFLVMLASAQPASNLAFFLAAQGAASLLGGTVWGAFADRSSRRVLVLTGALAGIFGLVVVYIDRSMPSVASSAWFLPVAFFMLAVLHDGVRLGRKTYVLDLGGGNKRTDYVAVSNTVLGVMLLIAGALGAIAQQLAEWIAILIFAIAAFAASMLALRLPEVQ